MRILIITQYFWPENFKINDLVVGLKEEGNEITVITAKPNYPGGSFYKGYTFLNKRVEYWCGIKIYRCLLIPRGSGRALGLIANYFSFAFFAAIRVLFIKGEFDIIFVYEPSPVLVGIPAIVAKRRWNKPIFFWVQDLWPHTLTAATNIRNRFLLRQVDNLTKFIYSYCDRILVQSRAFRPYLEQRQHINPEKIVYYPNTAETFYRAVFASGEVTQRLPSGFIIMFAGNLGESQSFDTLLDAAVLLKHTIPDLKWVILGDGRQKEYIQKKIRELRLEQTFILLGAYPPSQMPVFFACAQGLIVSLKDDEIFSMTIPSKVQSYMACAKPLIGSLNGEGARIILDAGAGVVAEAENAKALAKEISTFYSLSDAERQNMGINARKYYEQEFDRDQLVQKLINIFKGYIKD